MINNNNFIYHSQLKFKAIGIMSQIDSNNHALNYDDLTEAKANDSDGTNKLKVSAKDCPKKTSPKQCLSPNRVVSYAKRSFVHFEMQFFLFFKLNYCLIF